MRRLRQESDAAEDWETRARDAKQRHAALVAVVREYQEADKAWAANTADEAAGARYMDADAALLAYPLGD